MPKYLKPANRRWGRISQRLLAKTWQFPSLFFEGAYFCSHLLKVEGAVKNFFNAQRLFSYFCSFQPYHFYPDSNWCDSPFKFHKVRNVLRGALEHCLRNSSKIRQSLFVDGFFKRLPVSSKSTVVIWQSAQEYVHMYTMHDQLTGHARQQKDNKKWSNIPQFRNHESCREILINIAQRSQKLQSNPVTRCKLAV
jgi:hypothetical protein